MTSLEMFENLYTDKWFKLSSHKLVNHRYVNLVPLSISKLSGSDLSSNVPVIMIDHKLEYLIISSAKFSQRFHLDEVRSKRIFSTLSYYKFFTECELLNGEITNELSAIVAKLLLSI